MNKLFIVKSNGPILRLHLSWSNTDIWHNWSLHIPGHTFFTQLPEHYNLLVLFLLDCPYILVSFNWFLFITYPFNVGIPKVTILIPLPIYTHSLDNLIQLHTFKNHLYTPNSQIYICKAYHSLQLHTPMSNCLPASPFGWSINISDLPEGKRWKREEGK